MLSSVKHLPPAMTAAQIRVAEERAMRHVSESRLMSRAADAVAAECEAILGTRFGRATGNVVVLAGTGNNGGDAMLAGARLHYRGTKTTVVLVGPRAHELGLGECLAAGTGVIDATQDLAAARAALETADLVIDGIVGISGSPGLRPPADALVAAISPLSTVVAVDLPSGLDVDSGQADAPHVRAHVTVTFTAPKPCLATDPARASAGRVVVANVGVLRA